MPDSPTAISNSTALKWLRILVYTMTVVFICGFIIMMGLFLGQFMAMREPPPQVFPDRIALPLGVVAETFSISEKWYAIISTEDEVIIFDRSTGEVTHRIELLQK